MPAFSRFLRYFTEVARLGSIRRAADELRISASAIDRQILAAEEELGMRLFERLPTGLRLTAAGELLMSAGMRWQKGLGEVRSQMEDLKGLRRGHVDIAVIDALAKGFIPRLVQDMRQDYPGISIGLKVLDNINVQAAIASGDVDLGILLDPQSPRDIHVRAHAEVVLGFVVPIGHELISPSCRFASGAGHPIVAPAAPLALCRQVELLEATTQVPLDIVARSDNIQMIKSLVIGGVGVGILTSLDVAAEVRASELVFIPISDSILNPLTLGLCIAPARQLSSAAKLVLGRIESQFDELGAS